MHEKVLSTTTPEALVLLACLRSDDPKGTDDAHLDLIEQGIDWDRLLELAGHHGLIPMLYWGLKRKRRALIPEQRLSSLSDHFHASQLRSRLAIDSFSRCSKILASESIPCVVVKGLVLAETVYEHPALRPFGDIDILIPEDRADRAGKLLVQQGYRPIYPPNMLRDPSIQALSAAQTRIYLRNYHEVTFQSQDDLMQIDLHWRLAPRLFPSQLDLGAIWREVRTVTLDLQNVLTLSPPHHLLYICMHATKDHWRMLKWVVDVDRLIRAEKDIDWKRLASLAKGFGISRMLGVGIGLARLLLDTPIPDDFPLLRKHSSRDLSPICDRLFDPDRRPSRVFRCLGINRLYLGLCDDWPARLTYVYRSLAMPRPEDEVLFGTARVSGPAWGLRRPFLVVGRCASRMGRPRSDGIAPFTH